MFEIYPASSYKFHMLAWGYRIKILLRCDFFRYDALRLLVSTPKASFRNFASSREQNIRNLHVWI
jgi:hypothetical protein